MEGGRGCRVKGIERRELVCHRDLLGTSQLDATSDLLVMLDTAEEDDGLKFNGAVLRRALKSRANSDFKMQRWEALTTHTFDVISKRFIQEDDGVDCGAFITLLCSQIWQKLLKTTTTATKSKDCSINI